ncbi:MAG: efflux RND transporter periplasmic adaptor subunit [Hyphomicrobiaceae bacterium]|nr:efflux RND transporter periplasmic adaptor subunit [Hyphomicrobiaceae bacterium]
MKSKRSNRLIAAIVLVVAASAGAAAYLAGWTPAGIIAALEQPRPAPSKKAAAETIPPAVTVAKVATEVLVETVLVTGTLVPRDEILVAPEVEGLRVIELKAEVGDRVRAGDVLATLERTQIESQLAQNTATLARTDALIAQAKSQIAQAEAAASEAQAAFQRAQPLRKSGFVSESVFDQREAAQRTTAAMLIAARDGLKVAEATKAETAAQRRELEWRLGNTQVKAPRNGIVSRRTARVGAVATAAAEPMFRIIADGEIELDAEATEAALAKIRQGQRVTLEVAGVGAVRGTVRLVSPEVDRSTRLGSVRIFIGDRTDLRIGAFARGRIVTSQGRGLVVPASAVLYSTDATSVQRVTDNHVETRIVETGLRSGGQVEIRKGLAEGDLVVAKAGTFLRNGDRVRPMVPDPKVSEAR